MSSSSFSKKLLFVIVLFGAFHFGIAQGIVDPFAGGISQYDFDRGQVANDLVYVDQGESKEVGSLEARMLYYQKNSHLDFNDHFSSANILNSNNSSYSTDTISDPVLGKTYYSQMSNSMKNLPEAQQMEKGKREIWNTSFMNPSLEGQQVWVGESTVEEGRKADEEINLSENSLPTLKFESVSFFKAGHVAMSASRQLGIKKEKFVLHFNLTVHNFLLNKMILRKMGYVVPAMKRLARTKIIFSTVEEKENWKKTLEDNLTNAYSPWVAQEEDLSIVFNDVVATPEDNSRLNFATDTLADLPLSIIKQNKRVYNALPLFWVLGNVPISIEQFSPIAGRVVSEHFFLDFNLDYITPNSDIASFNIHRDDAIWAVRKIANLSENDWDEIVSHSGFPQTIHQALKALLMARRDSLLTAFNFYIDAKKFNPKIRESLKNWEKETDDEGYFPTYARKFNLKDPEPEFLSYTQINNFLLSRLMTKAIGTSISQLNGNKYFNGNLNERLQGVRDTVADRITDYINSNGTTELSDIVTPYRLPIAGGQLIFNREIALGNTLGTDNYVQLVDVFGASVYLGGMYGEMGHFRPWGQAYGFDPATNTTLRELIPLDFSATARVSLSRTYAHVKPIVNIKQAFKYPFRNAIVPFLMKSYGKNLKRTKSLSSKPEEQAKNNSLINEMLIELDESMKDNESIIINDSLNIDASILGQINFKALGIKVVNGIAQLVVRRIHLRKLSRHRFQVYHDTANLTSITAALGAKLWFFPLIKFNFANHLGRAKVRFYNLDLSNARDPERRTKLAALSSLLRKSSIRKIKKLKPVVIHYKKIRGLENRQEILVFRRNAVNQFNKITVTHPNGEKLDFIRRYRGTSVGIDVQSFSEEILGNWVNKLFEEDVINIQVPFLNPGYSFLGRAKNKISQYEALLNQEGQVTKEVSKVTLAYNGWSMKAKKAEKILKKVKQRIGHDFFPEDILHKANKLFMYTIHFSLFVGHKGIRSLLNKNTSEIKQIFKKYHQRKSLLFSGKDSLKFSGVKRFLRLRRKFVKALENNNHKKRSKYLTSMTKLIFHKLKVKGLVQLLGSSKNFLITSGIDGFRSGDESGDRLMSLHGNTFGSFAKEYMVIDPRKLNWSMGSYGALNLVGGPLSEILQSQQITPGEFYINWLQGRLM